MPASMTPPRSRPPIARSYLRELEKRVRRAGIESVAKASGLHRNSVRRTLTSEDGRGPTLDTIEAIRAALVKLGAEPMPPPLVAVRDSAHYRAIRALDKRRK